MNFIISIITFILFFAPSMLLGQNCFTASSDNVCPGEIVTFTVRNPQSGVVYIWSFGDGSEEGSGIEVGHSFPHQSSQETYSVTLFEDGNRCGSSDIRVKPTPDPIMQAVTSGGVTQNGTNISACSGSAEANIRFFNGTQNPSVVNRYRIDWGDGGVTETYTNADFSNSQSIEHTFNRLGFFSIKITAEHSNGCNRTKTYSFYNGSNPGVGLANPGSTVGLCAPATIEFPITNTENNPPGTTYEIFVGGASVATFNQNNVPSIFSYTFEESSCDAITGNGQENSFDLTIMASNPCNSTTATIQPIQLSSAPKPEISFSSSNNNCPGETFRFTNTSEPVEEVVNGECQRSLSPLWNVSPGSDGAEWDLISGSFFDSDEIELRFNISGTYSISLTLSSGACGDAIKEKTISIQPPPMADADAVLTDGANGCEPLTYQFQNLSTGQLLEYDWEISPSDGSQFVNGSDRNSKDPFIRFTKGGAFTVSLTTSNVCDEDDWDTTILVASQPDIQLALAEDACESTILNFDDSKVSYMDNGSPIISIHWDFQGASPISSIEQYPQNIRYDLPGTYIYSVTATNTCGPTTIQDTFIVQAPPTLILPPDSSVCVNLPPFLLSFNPTGGSWSGAGVNESGRFDPQQAGPGMHELTYEYGTGLCSAQGHVNITVQPLPEVTAGSYEDVCENGGVIQLQGQPAGGTWSVNNNGILDGNLFDPHQNSPGTYSFSYWYEDANQCSNSATTQIKIHPLPEVTAEDASYCNTPGLVDLPSANPPGGIWFGPGVSGNSFDPQSAGGVNDYTLTYAFTNTNGCTDSTTATISVIDPENVQAGPDTVFCVSETAYDLSFLASPAGGSWQVDQGSGSSGNTFNPSQAGVGTYVLTYSVGSGNCLVTDQLSIVVRSLPEIELGGNQDVVCVSEETVALQANPTGGQWSVNNSGVLEGNTFKPQDSGAGTYTLTYAYQDASGCSNESSFEITVHPLPEVTAEDASFCNTPGVVDLPSGSPPGGTWSGPGVSGNSFDPQSAGGVNDYTLTYAFTNTNGCTDSTTATISVIDPENVQAGPDTVFCVSETAYDLSFLASPAGGSWQVDQGSGSSGNTFNPSQAGVGTYVLTYSVGSGNCLVTDQLSIVVRSLPEIELGGNQDAVCISEEAVVLQANPSGGQWSVNNSGVLEGNTFKPQDSGAGTYTLTYAYQDASGCSNESSFEITVHPLPEVTAEDASFCNTPGLVDLPSANPPGGIWSGPGVSGNSFDPQAAGGVNDYSLTYIFTNTNGCTDSTMATISVIEPPIVEAGKSDTVCITDGIIQLGGFSPENGLWSGNGIVDGQMGRFDPEIAGGGEHILIYSFGGGNCEVKDSITMLVIDLSNTDAGLAESFCLSDLPMNLSGQSPVGGFWTGAGIKDSILGTFLAAEAGIGSHIIRYTLIDQLSGCSAEDTKMVTVNPMPESVFFLPAEACINQEIQFTNESVIIEQSDWTFGDGISSELDHPVHVYRDTGYFTIQLIATTSEGCTDTSAQSIFITEPPIVDFAMDRDSGCAVLEVGFDNLSSGYEMTYDWDFGNGETSKLAEPGIIAFDQGIKDTTYTITLNVTNQCAMRQKRATVKVFPLPIAIFGVPVDTSCTPMEVRFSNPSLGNPESFFWDFGNGQSTTDSLPAPVTYYTDTTITVYTIQLIAENFCGSDTISRQVVVEPVDVQAFFNLPFTEGCQPFEVPFTNFSTPGASIQWDFGDGNTSSEPDPVHTFREAGEYQVIQFAGNGCGYDTAYQMIKVLPAPEVSFEHAPYVCVGQPISFTNTSPQTVGHLWHFGDGDSSRINSPEHIFQEPGIYTVTLSGVSAVNGCSATFSSRVEVVGLPTAAFEPSTTDGCVPLSIRFNNTSIGGNYYQWDFGDTNTSIEENPRHTFHEVGTYSVSLVTTDLNGCFNDTSMLNIIVHPVPKAGFSFVRNLLCGTPVEVQFSNTSQGAEGYQWDFGDGSDSPLVNPNHIYQDTGLYNIRLIATNPFNCMDTLIKDMKAYPIPIAEFDVTQDTGCVPFDAQFLNMSSMSNRFQWDFGDGRSSNERNPIHTYFETGVFDVRLQVSYDDVCFDSLSLAELIVVRPSPFANFTYEEDKEPIPSGSYQFFNLSENAIRYEWEFEDGTISEEENPLHRFYQNGAQQIKLTAIGVNNCSDDTLLTLIPTFFKGLFIPNALSPEQGIGDVRVFKPNGAGLKEYHIQIFSQYGEQIWESSKLEEGRPKESWDGTLNGALLPPDVYVWKAFAIFEDGTVWQGMKGKDGKLKTMGSLLLIR